MSRTFIMRIDLDERGVFKGHIEDPDGELIFNFSNEDRDGNPEPGGGLWLVDFGYMRHTRDIAGMLGYLQSMGYVGLDDRLVLQDARVYG
jgi:hypothetical protein